MLSRSWKNFFCGLPNRSSKAPKSIASVVSPSGMVGWPCTFTTVRASRPASLRLLYFAMKPSTSAPSFCGYTCMLSPIAYSMAFSCSPVVSKT
jgi:hypothetical protein